MASAETDSTLTTVPMMNGGAGGVGTTWTSANEKSTNNNGMGEGNTRLEESHIPEDRTSLTEDKSQTATSDEEDYDDSDTECGLGRCVPVSMQKFASKQSFLMVFCIAWVLQGMYHTYFVSAITTIEKLFQIQSKITGIIMSATEIGQIGSSLLLTYYGGHGHRPKWIAWGMVLFAVSSFTCSLPHFIYGRQLINANDLTGISKDSNICKSNLTKNMDMMSTIDDFQNFTPFDENLYEHRIQPSVTKIVLAIFFISLLGVGMGQTAVYTLGIPYIDDNVASKESPLYFAITIGVRILGPALGFIVGSFCTSVYADLSVDPKIDTSDPRWVGAWWLGLVLISALLMLTSFAMFTFPKRLPSARPQPRMRRSGKKHPSIRDFPKTVKRLLKNDILMFRTASSVLHILPIAGLYTFLPKYLESQFRLPTPSANMISGVGGILVMGLGIIISGVFILRVKPNARFVAAWIAFTAVVYALGMGILMFIGCPMHDLEGHGSLEPICNTTLCACSGDKFAPICGEDGKTYYSACHAGCRNFTERDGKIIEYSDCICMRDNATIFLGNEFDTATIGYCDVTCNNFFWYIVLFSVFVFIHSTSEVGSMLLILRCVDPRDKAMALGLIQFAIGLFGNVPCPIVYGAVVDSACLDWKQVQDEKGACNFYDSSTFRTFYHGTTGAILLCAFFVDLIVWYKAGSINFVDEQAPLEEELHAIKGRTEICE
ncbi:PREDICTED: solute carrier organic anion transporter family member 3A1 [Nicrophorus vespilloides]|uniref:Solute carrier organic anion transporter family member n=1 Tax=Nicrophorus vespilloides TaxID=110193 RepID=A0ABM1N4D1_NICVS|nr:PREDICTED: solute carrier organic anion transporter family member 3A1 [Nicrophorus vespilloides]XP_017781678.1 PREDICTED: solute carrier organic anion transporter family member 3A1 [Nicrophorus vespilloides]XP_017781679.1 PREDICTED: solute carrier organic anion transporter family member 3A1 [Nicrophorus vespilloides]XP_017781680.1 PREDICTED: solute carrier organic anion transporter family member 3A1 [Nicrophorus vespilloides]XP_017781681.1 PREDICTED: solute carrier organic anion transporter 